MIQTFKDLWQIAKKDLIEFGRDRLRLVTLFIMPMFMMIMVGFIFPNQNTLKDIQIGVANEDGSQVSQQLVSAIASLKLSGDQSAFVVHDYASTDAIKDAIKSQDISGGIDIPSDFSKSIASSQQATVTIIQDQSSPQISQMVNQILTQVVNGFSSGVSAQKVGQILVNNQGVQSAGAPSVVNSIIAPVRAELVGIIPGNPNYFEFVAPGIMAMVVMTSVLTGLAASVSREKEQGTLDGILISPISRLAIILGKALSQAIRGLIQGAIVLLLASLLFGVTIHGNILLVGLLLLLGIFSFVGLGILVSALASEQETATQLLFMFQFPMLFLSGVFFPIALMPSFMQSLARVIPLTYAINALRQVMVLGAGFHAVQSEVIILVLFGVVTLGVAVPVFKRVITK